MLKKPLLFSLFISICCSSSFPQDYEAGFSQRAQALIVQAADFYRPPPLSIDDPEKYYWPKAIARFEQYGQHDSSVNEWVERLKDRPPFHFTLVGMARIMSLYPEAPAIRNNKVLLLKKVFERTDSYNAFTAEGTENHINMSRTSGYIFAQHAMEYPDEFPEAGSKLGLMKSWLLDWSRKVYQLGTGEWNSSIYETYNVIGWLNVYDFARDPEIKAAARAVLDYYASEIALHYSWGTPGGTEMRGTGAENINNNATRYLGWLWFGPENGSGSEQISGNQFIQCVHAVTSSYRPPDPLIELARKEGPSPAWYVNSNPSYLFEEPSFVKNFFYLSENFTLGSCLSPYGGWTGSTYQMVNWRLIVKPDDCNLPFEIGGNGRFYDNLTGKTTNPFTQIVQHRNILLQMTRTPENANELTEEVRKMVDFWADNWKKDFQIRFPKDDKPGVVKFSNGIISLNEGYITLPEQAVAVSNKHCTVITIGNVHIGITVISGKSPMGLTNIPQIKDRLFLFDKDDPGHLCGFVLEIVEKGRYPSVEQFIKIFSSIQRLDRSEVAEGIISYLSTEGTRIKAQYCSEGQFKEAISDWGYGAKTQQVIITAPPFRQPDWPKLPGTGKTPGLWVNDTKISFTGIWPVFNGPALKLDKGILEIRDSQQVYRVDYSGNLPVFSNH